MSRRRRRRRRRRLKSAKTTLPTPLLRVGGGAPRALPWMRFERLAVTRRKSGKARARRVARSRYREGAARRMAFLILRRPRRETRRRDAAANAAGPRATVSTRRNPRFEVRAEAKPSSDRRRPRRSEQRNRNRDSSRRRSATRRVARWRLWRDGDGARCARASSTPGSPWSAPPTIAGFADDAEKRGSGDAREARRDAREVAETRRRARRLRAVEKDRACMGFAQRRGAGRARARPARRRAARAGAAAAHARARPSSRRRRRGRFFFGRRRRRRRRRRTRRPRNGRRDPKKKTHLTIDELRRSSARFGRVDARRAGGYLRASLASRRRAEPRVVRGSLWC